MTTAQMQTIINGIISSRGEIITISRATNSYDAQGMATRTWTTLETFTGWWQPLVGQQIRDEAGREVKSTSVIYAAHDVAIQEGDKIETTDGKVGYVNYVKDHATHLEIYIKTTSGQE